MNYWKKMAFVLALVAGLCGGAWAQGWEHHDRERGYRDGLTAGQFDRSHNRSYRVGDYKAYKNGDQVYRSGFLEGYNEAFGRHGYDDRWERREGFEYRTFGDRDRPPGWERGEKTGWENCGLPPGQAKKYECRTYVHEGRPHYYYQDEQGRIVVRRPATEAHGDAERH